MSTYIKGFVIIHLIEYLEKFIPDDKIEEIRKSNDESSELIREAYVYSNDYPINYLHKYHKLLEILHLSQPEYIKNCGIYLGENLADQYLYIYRGSELNKVFSAFQNLYPYIVGMGNFSYCIHTTDPLHQLWIEIELDEQIPTFMIEIFSYAFEYLGKFSQNANFQFIETQKVKNRVKFLYKYE